MKHIETSEYSGVEWTEPTESNAVECPARRCQGCWQTGQHGWAAVEPVLRDLDVRHGPVEFGG